jgi:hypothetical protein
MLAIFLATKYARSNDSDIRDWIRKVVAINLIVIPQLVVYHMKDNEIIFM